MEDVLEEIWFRDQFLPHRGAHRPQLLLLDSHETHIEAAKENNIHPMTFPLHSTHWLCPLDKTIFSPLQKAYDHTCSIFMNSSPNNKSASGSGHVYSERHTTRHSQYVILEVASKHAGFTHSTLQPFHLPHMHHQYHTSSNRHLSIHLPPMLYPANLHPLSSPSPLLPLSSLVNHPQTLTVN